MKPTFSFPLIVGILLAIFVALPWLVYPIFAANLLCFALFASAFNLLVGYVGLLSFGHAAFFGLAAYVAGYAAKELGLPTELALLLATVAALVLGAVFGAIAVRRGGLAFAMITLALSQLLYFVLLKLPFTGGENGLQAVPRGHFLGLIDLSSDINQYYLVLVVAGLAMLGIVRIVRSPFGDVLQAVRENENRAASLGYDVTRYKWIAFTLSAGLAGLAGGLKAMTFQFATLTDAHWAQSGHVVLMTLIGGIGTLLGPILGAAVMVTIESYLAETGAWVTILTGAIFVACVLTLRNGVFGLIRQLLPHRNR